MQTRFPPEPNGYLHIGHAKAICLDFGLAAEFGGKCNLRFDDTNPSKEETEYVDSIMEDVRWLGFEWDGLFYASDYFGQLYEWAVQLIKAGKAYVCDLTAAEIREYRGTLTEPGKESPYRERSVEENLDLFERMKKGEFPDGSRTLRAKIDMASPNLNMRDPVMYRILHTEHHRTGNRMVHLPDVRLRARAVGFDREGDPLDLYSRIRRSPSAVQLVYRTARHLSIPAVRVRPAQHHLYAAEQTQAADSGAGRARERVGTIRACPRCRGCGGAAIRRKRSAASARTSSVSKTNNTVQLSRSRALRPRRPEQARGARHGGVAAVARRHRQLSGRSGRGDGRRQQSRR